MRLAEKGHVEHCISSEILSEVRDVLTRPKIRQQFSALTAETVSAFLARVSRFAVAVSAVPRVVSFPRDTKDEKYLDLAVAVGAECLVSRDNDLLDLMDTHRPECQVFRAAFPQITILDPISFLRAFSKQTADRPR